MSDPPPGRPAPDGTLPGAIMSDPSWLAERILDTGRRWTCTDARINGTLWWYSASSTLVSDAIAVLLATGRAPTPRLQSLRVTLHDNGYVAKVGSSTTAEDRHGYSAALIETLTEVITPLAAVSGAAPRALWAIASDSIANRALDAGHALNRIDAACTLAATLCIPPLISPRFITTPVRPRAGTRALPSTPILRRSSCCLIYQATNGDKCTSCPRRPRRQTTAGTS